jgi:hypothetical protein
MIYVHEIKDTVLGGGVCCFVDDLLLLLLLFVLVNLLLKQFEKQEKLYAR